MPIVDRKEAFQHPAEVRELYAKPVTETTETLLVRNGSKTKEKITRVRTFANGVVKRNLVSCGIKKGK